MLERWLKGRRKWLLVPLAMVVAGGAFVYFWLFHDLPAIESLEEGFALPSTRIYDREGRLLYEIIDQQNGKNTPLPLDDIPLAMQQATIATEDANFYEHPGVDVVGILRAAWINVRGGEVIAGGSTITQQVARTLLMDPEQRAERTLRRKLREGILAVQLTATRPRDDILALYLNQIYYGNMAYGVEAAAQTYFGKPARELDLAESAMIAGLAQAPAYYDPLTNPASAEERQETVLDLMVNNGFITAQQAELAKAQPLQFASAVFPIKAPHFVMAVWEDLRARFPEALITGGLEVTTTLDIDWQNAARTIAERRLAQLNDFSIDQIYHNATNAAIVALDPHTGQVLAMLGSPDYFDDAISGAVNMAVAPRQPGSALKPFTYALSFDPARPDPWTPATVLLDVRTAFVTRRLESYVPHNFSLDEHGPVRIREALANSYNIPAVIALDHLGVGALIDFLGALGITTLDDPGRYDLALTLGGGEVRLVELAGAYGTFANGGYLIPPALLLEVRDNAGNVLYRYEPPAEPPRVMDARVAWQITDILSDNAARMPAFGPNSVLNIGRPAAAKTGTTTDFRDNWTVGYTPNLVVGVWVGNTDHSPMIEVSGISGAGPIWHDFMREALKGQPELAFERPDGLVKVEVCELSGLLPTPECPRRVPEWFIEGTEPTSHDTFYRRAAIDAETGALATESTPPERIAERVYIVLPPEAREWAASQGIEPFPDDAPSALAQGFGGLRLLAPDPYTVYTISPRTPIETQQIAISAGVSPGTRRVEYFLDGESLGAADSAPWEIWWQLEAGEHVLVAEAALADGSVERSEPVPFTVAAE